MTKFNPNPTSRGEIKMFCSANACYETCKRNQGVGSYLWRSSHPKMTYLSAKVQIHTSAMYTLFDLMLNFFFHTALVATLDCIVRL